MQRTQPSVQKERDGRVDAVSLPTLDGSEGLSPIRWLGRERPPFDLVRRIAVWLLCPIGDTLFATPALRGLRKRFPAAHITAITWTSNRDVLAHNPNVDQVLSCKGTAGLPRIIAHLQTNGYELAVGLSNAGSYVALCHKAPYRVGFHSDRLGWLYDFASPERLDVHAAQYCLDVVAALGVEPQSLQLDWYIAPQERAEARRFLEQNFGHNLLCPPLVAIHPGGKHFAEKRWPIERFATVADALLHQMGAEVLIVGGPDDVPLAEQIVAGISGPKRPIVAVSRTSLRLTAALIENCQLFIGNDSAPLHIAAAVGTKTIGLYGPTTPANFGPLGEGHTAMWRPTSCSPCFRWLGGFIQYMPRQLDPRCRMQCMDGIPTSDVMEVAARYLSGEFGALQPAHPVAGH